MRRLSVSVVPPVPAVTLAPMCFVMLTTGSAAVLMLREYLQKIAAAKGEFPLNPVLSAVCVVAILLCSAVVVAGSLWTVVKEPQNSEPLAAAKA
jgi:hypothetical protein